MSNNFFLSANNMQEDSLNSTTLILVAVLIIGGILFFFLRKKDNKKETDSYDKNTSQKKSAKALAKEQKANEDIIDHLSSLLTTRKNGDVAKNNEEVIAQSKTLLENANMSHPQQALVYCMWGISLWRKDKKEEAVDKLRKATALFSTKQVIDSAPSNFPTTIDHKVWMQICQYLFWIEALYLLDEDDDAYKLLIKLHDANQENLLAYSVEVAFFEILYDLENAERIESTIEKLLATNRLSQDEVYLLQLPNLIRLHKNKEISSVVELLYESYARLPNPSSAPIDVLLEMIIDQDNMDDLVEKIANLNANDSYIRYLWAKYLYHLGDYERASEKLVDDDNSEVKLLRVKIMSKCGNPESVLDYLDQALIASPENDSYESYVTMQKYNSVIQNAQGEIYQKMGESIEAIIHYRESIYADYNNILPYQNWDTLLDDIKENDPDRYSSEDFIFIEILQKAYNDNEEIVNSKTFMKIYNKYIG